MKTLLEVCCGDNDSFIAAVRGGADRVELCSALGEGGLTPSVGMIVSCCRKGVTLHVLVRPRRGDFVYSEAECEVMLNDIRFAKSAGADGVVIGCLKADGTIDAPNLKRFVEVAKPMHVTFHRAFDLCINPSTALETLIESGCDTLLTSGMSDSAYQGMDNIASLVQQAGGRINIMAGAGVSAGNVQEIVERTGVTAVHGTFSRLMDSQMTFRREGVKMGDKVDEYTRKVTDVESVKKIHNILKQYRIS